jgi:hypothetical protein
MSIMDIYFAPSKIFSTLKEKPRWVMPLIIVVVVVALAAALTMVLAGDAIVGLQEEAMRARNTPEEQIEQVSQFLTSPVGVILLSVQNAVVFVIPLLIFAVVTNLFVPLFGGESGFKKIFSVICFSALVLIPAAILKVMIIAISKSPNVTTSLALLAPNLAKKSFVYQLLAGFDFFTIWQMILVAMGISITNDVVKKNSYILVFLIWLVSIFVGIGLGSIFGRGM